MQVAYVVLYVNHSEASRSFWVERIGMVEKRRDVAGPFTIVQVGFADQPFAFELVPLGLTKDNPDGLNLATPSIAFQVDDLKATHAALAGRGVQATDVGEHRGTRSFAFSDPEGRSVRGHGMSTTAGHRIFTTTVASVYPHYVAKVERKGRTQEELDAVIEWLTGYDDGELRRHLDAGTSFEDFFAGGEFAPERDADHRRRLRGTR